MLRGNPMGWPDLHGFVGVRDEKGGGSDEHEEHVEELTHTTRYKARLLSPLANRSKTPYKEGLV